MPKRNPLGINGRTPGDTQKRVTEIDGARTILFGTLVTTESYRTSMNKFDPDVYKRGSNRTIIYPHWDKPHIYCRTCSELKPATSQYFPHDDRNTGFMGLDRQCRDCAAGRQRRYRQQQKRNRLLAG